MVIHMRACLHVGIYDMFGFVFVFLFVFHSATRKVFEFFLFDRTLFHCCPSYFGGQQVKLNKRLFVWPFWMPLACSLWAAGHRNRGPGNDVLKIW